jgi:predicted small metal-binding protein
MGAQSARASIVAFAWANGKLRTAAATPCTRPETSRRDVLALPGSPAAGLNAKYVVPGCDYTAEAETEAELLKKVAAHAADAHGITEITPELVQQVRSKIKDR